MDVKRVSKKMALPDTVRSMRDMANLNLNSKKIKASTGTGFGFWNFH
jgi:hypothetical protein